MSFRCGILMKVSHNKQDFLPKINILKGNHCILRIQGVPVHQIGHDFRKESGLKIEVRKKCFLQKMVS